MPRKPREEKLADKITRGSLVGRFHDSGLPVSGEKSAARQWNIKQLDTQPLRGKPRSVSQTFATTEDWFQHPTHPSGDRAKPGEARPPFFSPRYWLEAVARSPMRGGRSAPVDFAEGPTLSASTPSLGNRPSLGGTHRTYDISEDWMSYSNPKGGKEVLKEAPPLSQHAVLGKEGMGVVPPPPNNKPLVANVVDGLPSPGKKTFQERLVNDGHVGDHAASAATRLRQDMFEPVPPARGRRTHSVGDAPKPEPRSDRFVPPERNRSTRSGTYLNNSSCDEIHQAVHGEVAPSAEEIKYLAGGQVVSSAKVGRRPAMVSTDPLSYAGWLQRAEAPRHQHNSDAVRQHLQPPAGSYPILSGMPPPSVTVRAAGVASGAMTPTEVASPRSPAVSDFHMFGNHSVVGGPVAKTTAYLSSFNVRPMQSLRPGVFSPYRPGGAIYAR
jgi:hypothetical protein